jgi:hypothetical protein
VRDGENALLSRMLPRRLVFAAVYLFISASVLAFIPAFVLAQNTTAPVTQSAQAVAALPHGGGQAQSAPAETRGAAARMIGDSLLNGQSYAYDEHLADAIGPRLTGSANFMRAVDWTEQQFKLLGLANVHSENWTIAAAWEPDGPVSGRITEPIRHELHIYSFGWSPATPRDGVSGEVVYVPNLAPAALAAQKAQITGKLALIDSQSFKEVDTLGSGVAALKQLSEFGPAAIVRTGIANGGESQSAMRFDGKIAAMPGVQIGLEDSLLIQRLLAQGPVKMEFTDSTKVRSDVEIPNVVAEIPGSELPGEVVLLGAHLDSWNPGTGAQDNGTGVASLLEAARAIEALHRAPRRTIRFVLFSGEEEGLLGSKAYVEQHLADLANIDAVLVADSGAQPALGWNVNAREDLKETMAAIAPLLSGLGADGLSSATDDIFSSDHAAFNVMGVPSLVLWNQEDKYNLLHHKASDTFDTVVKKDLAQNAAVVAVTAYAIADSPQPFAAHIKPSDMQAKLKAAGQLEEYLLLKGQGVLP